MSTTVSYKNDTLATINYGNSKILNTEATWLEDDITIEVDNLNLQTKTITPTTSTQQIICDNYQNLCKNINEIITNTTGTTISYDILSESTKTTGFLRLNGSFHVYYSQNPSLCYTTVTYNNYIAEITSSHTSISNGTNITIINEGSNQNFWDSDFKSIFISYKTSNPQYLRFGCGFDSQHSAGTIILELENFTVDYNTVNSWENYDALQQVTVNPIPSNYIVPTGTIQISGNGTYDVSSYATAEASFASTINNQNKTVTPTESQQTISADSGYTGLGTVTVNAISNTYVGSGITSRSSSDLTASGATVTVPAGYYASQATKSVSTTTHPNPTVSVNSSTGLITASHVQTAGYVSAGTTTATSQLSVQAATTITPTTTAQTAVAAGKYTTGTVTVAAIPANYIDSSSLKTYYTGSSAPSSSLGSNGDLYFQTLEV